MSSHNENKKAAVENYNTRRLERLDQLFKTVDKSQKDLSRLNLSHLEPSNAQMGWALASYKSKLGITTWEQLIGWIEKDMSTAQRTMFQEFITFNATLHGPFEDGDNYSQVASLILGIAISTGITIPAFSQTVVMFRIIRGYTEAFKLLATDRNFGAAKAQFTKVREAAKATLAGTVSGEVRYARLLGSVAGYDAFLGTIGKQVTDYVQDITKMEDEAQQKEAAITGIGRLQTGRLSSSYFLADAPPLAAIVGKMTQWIVMTSADTPGSEILAKTIAREIVEAASEPGAYASLADALKVLKEKDEQAGYYGDDDLPDAEVLKGARVDF